jgi:DNA-binding MarR family transcriptional regulator
MSDAQHSPEPPSREAQDGPLFALFTEVAIVAQLSRSMRERRLPDGLLVTHFGVLSHLHRRGGPASLLALARAFQTRKASTTHTLAGLQARGLIETRPDPRDGRGKLVSLTDAGRRLRAEAVAAMGADLDAPAAAGWGAEDQRAVLPALSRLRAVLDAMRDAKAPPAPPDPPSAA